MSSKIINPISDDISTIVEKITRYSYNINCKLLPSFNYVNNSTSAGKTVKDKFISYSGLFTSQPSSMREHNDEFVNDTQLSGDTRYNLYNRFRDCPEYGGKIRELARKEGCFYCHQNRGGDSFELDHYCDKKKYPYLQISPLNLLPVCKKCNGKKSAKDYKNYVNPFIDDIPQNLQFLEFKFIHPGNGQSWESYEIKYSIQKGTDSKFHSHFHELELGERFALGIDTEFRNEIPSLLSCKSVEEFKILLKDIYNKSAQAGGIWGRNNYRISMWIFFKNNPDCLWNYIEKYKSDLISYFSPFGNIPEDKILV